MGVYIQPVSSDDLHNYQLSKPFTMIDNYVYLYHTDTLIALPLYPDTIQDSTGTTYQETSVLSSPAPRYSYSNSGPRVMQFDIPMHRDMMTQINSAASSLKIPDLSSDDYVDTIVKQLQSAALPRYGAAEKMVNPPMVAVRFGNDIFCKGVVQGGVSVTYSGPILRTNKYSLVTVNFTVHEVDPYDADYVALAGGFRGLSTSLERRVWRS